MTAMATCGAHAAGGDPILIGLIAGTTGAYGTTGVQTVQGAQIAVDELNAKGGLLGRPVKLEWHDDNASGTLSGQLFRKLVSEGAVAIVGSPATGPVTAQLADRYRIPDIGVVDGGGLTVYPQGPDGPPHAWVFEFGGNTFAWGGKDAQYALKHCPGGLAVIHDRTSYGQGGLAGIQDVLAHAGKKIASDQPVTENWSTGATASFTPEINVARQAGADCVVDWLTPQDQAAFAQEAHALGAHFTILGNDEVNADDTFVRLAGAGADGAIGAFLTATLQPDAALRDFTSRYKAKFGQDPSQYSETTYDSVIMLADVVRKANSTDARRLRDGFEHETDFDGITGKLGFSAKKHETISADDLTLVRYDAAAKRWVPLPQ